MFILRETLPLLEHWHLKRETTSSGHPDNTITIQNLLHSTGINSMKSECQQNYREVGWGKLPTQTLGVAFKEFC